MGRDAQMEARLRRWADWVCAGDPSGYPSISVLSKEWMPAVAGAAPTMKVAPASDVHQTHRAVGLLPLKLRNAVVSRYVLAGSVDEQATRLGCAPDTVRGRIERAHRALMRLLDDQSFCNNAEEG